MSNSPPITISSDELRARVEDVLDRWIPDQKWENGETYARHKLDIYRERWPAVTHYDNDYLVMLTADTIREAEFAGAINSISESVMVIAGTLQTQT